MVESAPGTPRPTEPERRIRTRVPYSAEVIEQLSSRGQAEHLLLEKSPTHHTPETPAELKGAKIYAHRLQEIIIDVELGHRLADEVMGLAGSMMEFGDISEKQFLAVGKMYDRTRFGEFYTPFDTSEEYIKRFGSIHDQEPK